MLSLLFITLQEDHPKASPVMVPMSAEDIVLEQQSLVNRKCQTKALTPPVSLKNYFTVKPKCFDPESKPSDLENIKVESHKNESVRTLCVEAKTSNSDGIKRGKVKTPVQMKLMDAINAMPSPTSSKGPIDEEMPQGKVQSSVEKEQAPRSRKRKINVEPSRSTNSLTKMFKQTDSLCATKCPVCGLVIEDASNSAINLHLDSCLAKSISQSS